MSLWASKASMAIASRDEEIAFLAWTRPDRCRVSAQGPGLGLAGANVGSEGERG